MNLEQFPERMRQSMRAYIEVGQPPGDFLRAVLTNDFLEAVGRADYENVALLPAYALWVYNDVPHAAHGSRAEVSGWVKDGGLRGRVRAALEPQP